MDGLINQKWSEYPTIIIVAKGKDVPELEAYVETLKQ